MIRLGRGRRRNRLVLPSLLTLLAGLVTVEGYRLCDFYQDLSSSRSTLVSLKADLNAGSLESSEQELEAKRARLLAVSGRVRDARSFSARDPALIVASHLPFVSKDVRAARELVAAADDSVDVGLRALDVALAFAGSEGDPQQTSLQRALAFIDSQQPAMQDLRARVDGLSARLDRLPDGLRGPLEEARDDLHAGVLELDALVDGYEQADEMLPRMFGADGTRRYLVLPQNDTELFPSGGLISSYGIVTFEGGRLTGMQLEYFGTLFDRWQAQTHEYVEPPGPLKNYLKRGLSWALGEAGWYPDFPTTASLARSFVAKGGAPATDGTIAIDMYFIQALLQLLGPVAVPDYGVTVTAANLRELSLTLTRDEGYVPGQERKAFLSHLSQALTTKIFAARKEQWLDLLQLLDRMARERHLQLSFVDPELQALAVQYELDGSLVESGGSDFLLIADTSVNSTKLNLILQTTARLDLRILPDESVRQVVTYAISNPFPSWAAGRDANLVSKLMLSGVYGCYLRVYAGANASLAAVRINGTTVGPEQVGVELGRAAFGRFFTVAPGGRSEAQFVYQTPGVVRAEDDGMLHYRLHIQKQAGTNALPLQLNLALSNGAELVDVRIDGVSTGGSATVSTDLRTDRELDVSFRYSPR